MSPSPLFALRDIAFAIEHTVDFAGGRSAAELAGDPTRLAASERQLCIIGDALDSMSNRHPAVFARVEEAVLLMKVRDRLMRGRHADDARLVTRVVSEKLLPLRDRVEMLFYELGR